MTARVYEELIQLARSRGLEPADVVSELVQATAVVTWELGVPLPAVIAGCQLVWGELDASARAGRPREDCARARTDVDERPSNRVALGAAAAAIAGESTS